MNYNISIEGQTIQVGEDIGGKDELVRAALAPYFPEVANALISRKTEGETVTISVVKRAGTKGASSQFSVLSSQEEKRNHLIACAGGRNAAIELYEQIQDFERRTDVQAEELLAMDKQIEQAIRQGTEQAKAMEYAAERLAKSEPQAASRVTAGF